MGKRGRFRAVFTLVLILFMSTIRPFVIPASGAETSQPSANQNPPLEVINQKLEEIARQKNIPSVILKAIAFQESTWKQWTSEGKVVLGGSDPHPAIGIMQVATYNDADTLTIQRLKDDLDFNITKGADLLNEKWNRVPKIGDGERNKLENWYFAVWAYNSWSEKNNPRALAASTAASGSGLPTGSGTLPGSNLPSAPGSSAVPRAYQDKVWDLAAQPPDFLSRFIKASEITKIDSALLPAQGVPSASVSWETPQPVHLGDLAQAAQAVQVKRFAGSDRIDTAVSQALTGWPQGASSVVLARADDFPDALAGVPLAAELDAPVLLTSPGILDKRVKNALQTLSPQKVYLLGGEGALSSEISLQLQTMGWGQDRQVRLTGTDRYGTAAAISKALKLPASSVVLTTGENFPDALSIAAIAGREKMPVLLVGKSELPQATLEALQKLNPATIYLIGGESVVSEKVYTQAQESLRLPAGSMIRLGGADRYETMAKVAEFFKVETKKLTFATGEDYPDALSGAAFSVHQNSSLILIPRTSLTQYPSLSSLLSQKLQGANSAYIFGGEGAISTDRAQELSSLGNRAWEPQS
ncbi:cell wall-binding repeat-containing protein [Paradesulfitobacterium aromaticivorans]